MNLEAYNASWLSAWSAKDTEALMSFYHRDVSYFDAQMPNGLKGAEALRTYLERLFSEIPDISYEPDELWPIEGGFCARWNGSLMIGGEKIRAFRGFDLVTLSDDRIIHNEVYTHQIPGS